MKNRLPSQLPSLIRSHSFYTGSVTGLAQNKMISIKLNEVFKFNFTLQG